MLDKLARICLAENRTISRDILVSIIGKADGSLRDAENILDIILTLYDSEPPERVLQFLYGDIEYVTLELFANCCSGTLNECFLTVRKLWDLGANPVEIAEFMVNFVTNTIYLKSQLTVYRSSAIVDRLKEISNNIEQSKLNAIALAFTHLQTSGQDTLLSLELTVCDIFTEYTDVTEVAVTSDIEVW